MKKVLEAIKIKRESRKTQLLSQNIKNNEEEMQENQHVQFFTTFTSFRVWGKDKFSGISEDPIKKENGVYGFWMTISYDAVFFFHHPFPSFDLLRF